jgi:hypothetical protein
VARAVTDKHATLALTPLRDLDLVAGSEPDRPAYLSAASGLVCAGDEFYVVSDDELHLGCFPAAGGAPGSLVRIFPGDLPDGVKKRKKKKPDLEILLRLPADVGTAASTRADTLRYGALLALGSGSKAQRCRGALLPLTAHGEIAAKQALIDATPLFESLARRFDDLNLEGAWVRDDSLYLLQRGNKGDSPNAVIELDFGRLVTVMLADGALPDITPCAITELVLGDVEGVPLCFTDASGLPDGRWVFSAVAEDAADSAADGAFLGAAIGLASADHKVIWQRRVSPQHKIEGIDAQLRGDVMQLLCVTDADDPAVPAQLLAAKL